MQPSTGKDRARLRKTTPVFLAGDIATTMSWYRGLGFEADYFPPGFCILSRDDIEIFFQVHPGYVRRTILAPASAKSGACSSKPTMPGRYSSKFPNRPA